MELNSRLPEFLNMAAAKPFSWGEFDCGLWLGDWVAAATGVPNPGDPMRGRYRSEKQLAAMCGSAAAARMVRELLRRAGLKRTKDPLLGDVGVIEIPLPRQIVVGAIRGSAGWIVLDSARGMGLQRIPDEVCRPVMAYRVNERDA